jgi:hypothetical protein
MSGRPLLRKLGSDEPVPKAVMSTAYVSRRLPLAQMKSAERVPIKITRSSRLDPMECPDPRFDRFVIFSQLRALRSQSVVQLVGTA